MHRIVNKERLASNVVMLELEAKEIAAKHKAGQFVLLRLNEQGERIPITVAARDKEKGIIRLIIQEVGKTTIQLGQLETGDVIQDLIGPLGQPTHIENFGVAVCVGGGIGRAPIQPIAQALKEAGNTVISIIGARTKELIFLEDEMRAISDRTIVCTDDGSYARKGFVTEPLEEILKSEHVAIVVAIGPLPMMKACSGVTRKYGVRTIVSLNPIMVDGTGMCGGCRVSVGGETRFACVDGPEFDGHQVDFDELARRLRAYNQEEAAALKELDEVVSGLNHECKLEKRAG